MVIEGYWYTNIGSRSENEDSCAYFSPGPDQYCAVICDGLGGHGGGKAASSIGVKALADVIVTSGNAVKIVSQAPEDRPILFVPDQNLGAWVSRQLGRPLELWNGACHVHMEFTRDQILALKEKHPGVPVVAHPECTEAVRLLADHICSTEKMIPYCTESPAKSFIIVTESGILHRLRKLVPGKEFIPAPTEQCSCSTCPYMKMNTLEKLYLALRDLSPAVELPEDLRRRAEAPLLRMLEQSQS